MKIAHAVREAGTEQEIYVLLTAYIKAARLGEEMSSLSQHMTSLPLAGPDDVRGRIEGLFTALGLASKSLDDGSRVVLKEALYVFGEALMRLKWLESKAQRSEERPANRTHSTRYSDQPDLEET